MERRPTAWVGTMVLGLCTAGAWAGPVPIGTDTITVSYPTDAGIVSYSGSRDYNGTSVGDATPLGAAPNIRTFNSYGNTLGVFGRRTAPVLLTNPAHQHVLGPDESLMTHAFFKIDNNGDFFSGLIDGGSVTIRVDNIRFDQPVHVLDDTRLFHVKWNDQADELPSPYISLDDHRTPADNFRDFQDFRQVGLFTTFPTDNFILGDDQISWTITGEGTDTLGFQTVIPYDAFRNFEETMPYQSVPDGLPQPQGFLEPFHFHLEYVVVPEPGTLALLGAGIGFGLWRRRRRAC